MAVPRVSATGVIRAVVRHPLGSAAITGALKLRGRARGKTKAGAAREASDALLWLGALERAEIVLDRAIRSATHDEAALLRCRVEALRMTRSGRALDAHRVQAATSRALSRLDSLWLLGEYETVNQGLADVLELLFHPILHLSDRVSPLLIPQTDWLAPLRSSLVGNLLVGSPASDRRDPPAAAGPKLGFLTHGSRVFLDPLVEMMDREGFETRVFDIAEHPEIHRDLSARALLERRLSRARGLPVPLPASLVQFLEWADIVHAEWGNTSTAILSMCDLPVRKISRIHAFETRTLWMAITDWSTFDEVMFISPGLARMSTDRFPALKASRSRIVMNVSDMSRFAQPKLENASRTLALIGWNRAIKDPEWALRLFETLHLQDESWRLILVGDELVEEGEYASRVWEKIRGLDEAVKRLPFTNDVPNLFREVGYVLSSSLSEASHQVVVEGAASGACPVVRDWPAVSAWGGARLLYPADWIVSTPEEGAERVRCIAQSGPERSGREASEWIMKNRAWEGIRTDYLAAYGAQE